MRHLQAHHIHNWANAGETSLPNLVLLCTGHHAAVHEGTLSVGVHAGKIVFEAAGRQLGPAPVRDMSIDVM
jgi:predicted restriction endonuclease